jgi:hypothetical protein
VNQAEVHIRSARDQERELTEVLSEWVSAIGLRLRGSLRLAMAETKLAVTTFVLMIFLVVLSAGALSLAWALLLVALVQVLSLAGMKLVVAIAIVGAAHLLLAWLLWRLANSLGRHMEFRATRRMLGS